VAEKGFLSLSLSSLFSFWKCDRNTSGRFEIPKHFFPQVFYKAGLATGVTVIAKQHSFLSWEKVLCHNKST
jgi:hypothetical protein